MNNLAIESPSASLPATQARQGSEPAAGLVLCLQAALLSRQALNDAASAFAAELARALDCQRVSVGLETAGCVRVIASSDAGMLEATGAGTGALALAMNEARDQLTTLVYPPPRAARAAILLAHQRLTGASVAGVASIPLMSADRLVGILTLERRASHFADWEIALAEDAASFAGPVFEIKREALRPWWARLGLAVAAAARSVCGPDAGKRRLIPASLVAAALAATFVPLPYRVSAPARLEGEMQRAIVAPADGYLRQANVRAGDRVHAGQVLAELAGEDLELERGRRESELRQHENAYRTALARSDRSQMVINQARAGEAQAMLSLIESQIGRARIAAPFDGVVIKGDLTQQLGAPVAKGDVLLTLAPGDSFRLVVEVDEVDIPSIRTGSGGRLALAAGPDRSLGFTVRRIVPMATAADGRNYFEVDGMLDTGNDELRPGLRGIAKIEAGERSLGWIISHRAVAWLRLALWSAGWWSP